MFQGHNIEKIKRNLTSTGEQFKSGAAASLLQNFITLRAYSTALVYIELSEGLRGSQTKLHGGEPFAKKD